MIGACISQNERENDTKPPLKGKQHSQQTIRLHRDNGSTTETTTVTAAWSGHVSKLRSWYVVMGHVLMKQAWRPLKNSTLCCNYSDFNKRHEDAWSTLDCPTSPPSFPFLCPWSLTFQRQEMTAQGVVRFSSSMASSFSFSSLASPLPQWSPAGVAVPLKHANFLRVASTHETTPFILIWETA